MHICFVVTFLIISFKFEIFKMVIAAPIIIGLIDNLNHCIPNMNIFPIYYSQTLKNIYMLYMQ